MAGSKHPAPGLAEEVVVVLDVEFLEEVVELVEEQLDGPEIAVTHLVGEVGGVAAAELVVHNYGGAVKGCDVLEGEHVGVRDAGTAMEDPE